MRQASHLSHQTASRRAAPRRASRLRIMLLATSALASAALPITVVHADDAVWNPAGDTNFNNNGNWTDGHGGASVVPTSTATFNASDPRVITFNSGLTTTTVGGIAVTSGTGDYTFDTN